MTKIIGALIIIMATTLAGFILARRYSDRPKQLRQLRNALQSLEAEIMYGLTPVKEASVHLSEQLPEPLASFFSQLVVKLNDGAESLQTAWDETIEVFWHQTALKSSEKEILHQFGATLGKHDSENQKKQIQMALSHLEREESDARDMQAKYEKMTKSLGFLTGLLVVLLLF
ncbi:stage III sporulation protein AB [Scopulibacillus darangshiensis]|uniref:Stage III sporulation protein AB n=1 Tax=Scopulibacillus darangshiensis TaxID=442528 RepID=A0A4R2PA92_9BACL|nr:stage III sporulation protein SpoIIIAB [Scopulibacillus darangshiensis]TCP31174.1 stage III sporulation protein AB [Scopulibacillus darangshiensis]